MFAQTLLIGEGAAADVTLLVGVPLVELLVGGASVDRHVVAQLAVLLEALTAHLASIGPLVAVYLLVCLHLVRGVGAEVAGAAGVQVRVNAVGLPEMDT